MGLKEIADTVLRTAAEAGDVPGVVAMATDRKGTLYEGAFGKRVNGLDAPMTTDTVVWIASMTKALTSAAAMQLVERSKLDLDAPASRWAPALGEVQVLEGFDANGQPRMRAPKRPVTLRHLLTHTAGFSYEFWSHDIQRYQQVKGLPAITSCENAALRTPLLFDPGERWEYGINIDWAGKMVEAASGQKIGAYLREHLFAPLGMRDTAFKLTPEMRRRLAKIHQREGATLQALMELEIPQEPEFEMSGGGLYGTAGDYLEFVRMILNRGSANGTQVLKPDTVDLMAKNNMGKLRVTRLKTAMPAFSHDAEFFPGVEKSWGLAFQINEQPAPTGMPAGSLMWAGLANTFFWIDPRNGVGGVYLSQVLPFGDPQSYGLFLDFQSAVYRTLA
jgi:CubicO group peptidase (beta-lactamase class C family)